MTPTTAEMDEFRERYWRPAVEATIKRMRQFEEDFFTALIALGQDSSQRHPDTPKEGSD